MEIKRNEKLIKKLFNDFIQNDGFICGGFARVSVEDRDSFIPCGDIDIYCKNIEAYERIKTRLELSKYILTRESESALTLYSNFDGDLPIQLIKPLNIGHMNVTSENIMEILNNFDFTVSRVGILGIFNEENEEIDLKVFSDIEFEEDNKNKILNIKNIHCPMAEIYRVMKYMKKGYYIKIADIVKIFEDWENRPDNYKNNLIDKIKLSNPTQEDIDELEALLHID